jgi:hypothetical protein
MIWYGQRIKLLLRIIVDVVAIVWLQLMKLPPIIRQRTELVSFVMPKPAHLPFNMLAWGQFYIQTHNCPPPDATAAEREEYRLTGHIAHKILLGKSDEYVDNYRICTVNVFKHHHGIPFNATFHRWGGSSEINAARRRLSKAWLSPLLEMASSAAGNAASPAVEEKKQVIDEGAVPPPPPAPALTSGATMMAMPGEIRKGEEWRQDLLAESAEGYPHLASVPTHNPRKPIKHAYYTECDQVVRFDSMETMHALVAASNESTFFVGRRREKTYNSDPIDYMGNLDVYRHCGSKGFSMSWPKENIVQIES